MKQSNFFLTFMISINAISCLAMENDKKTISTLFKLAYENKPTKARTQESFYKQNLNNLNNHTQQLLEANNEPQTDLYTAHPTKAIRLKIVTDDLIPLNYKMKIILEYIERHNVYRSNYTGQTYKHHEDSPRLTIITSIMNSLKDLTTCLSDQRIEDYQLLIHHVTCFAVKAGHDEIAYENSWIHQHDPYILKALESISNKKYSAQILATLLNEETLHQETLEKKWQEYLDRKKQTTEIEQ